ncbi:MAG: hypothetical protein IPG50_28145 [Myxococcales bacterium]|nr:hypothetical protein [Myxococcales bacterium]
MERGKLRDTLIIEALRDKFIERSPIERQCTRLERSGGNRPGCWHTGVDASSKPLAPATPSLRRPLPVEVTVEGLPKSRWSV